LINIESAPRAAIARSCRLGDRGASGTRSQLDTERQGARQPQCALISRRNEAASEPFSRPKSPPP
jgi:hypothetical protein